MNSLSQLQRCRGRHNLLLVLVLCLGVYILTSGGLLSSPHSHLPPSDPATPDWEYPYEAEEELEGRGDDDVLSPSESFLKLSVDVQDVPRGRGGGEEGQGVVMALKTEGGIVEAVQNFVELECIAELVGYRVVLPSVSNGRYNTLHCLASYNHSLPFSHYFDIDRTNLFLDSFRLPPFANFSAVRTAPSALVLVFFVYSDDVVTFPNSAAGSFARDSLFPSEGPRNYARDCGKYLDPLARCVARELTLYTGRDFRTERALCVDANMPVSRKQFASYLGLTGKHKTLVLANWNGMKAPKSEGAKATFLDVKNRHTSKCQPPFTVPVSSQVSEHTMRFLEAWGLYPKDYVSMYVDLQLIMREQSNTTECMENLSNFARWWFVAEYPNRLAFITAPEYVDYPDRDAVRAKYVEIEDILRDKAFIGRVEPPELLSDEGKLVRDHGFGFLVETNIMSVASGLLIAGPGRVGSGYPVRAYFYNQHVHDFDFVMHLFRCS